MQGHLKTFDYKGTHVCFATHALMQHVLMMIEKRSSPEFTRSMKTLPKWTKWHPIDRLSRRLHCKLIETMSCYGQTLSLFFYSRPWLSRSPLRAKPSLMEYSKFKPRGATVPPTTTPTTTTAMTKPTPTPALMRSAPDYSNIPIGKLSSQIVSRNHACLQTRLISTVTIEPNSDRVPAMQHASKKCVASDPDLSHWSRKDFPWTRNVKKALKQYVYCITISSIMHQISCLTLTSHAHVSRLTSLSHHI